MKSKGKKIRKLIIIVLIILGIPLFCYWQNNSIVITELRYQNDKIPQPYNGFRIVQISDLHNKEFGSNQKRLLDKVKISKPDVIVITGDLIDSNHPNLYYAMEFITGAVELSPVYYVPGNHEAAVTNLYNEFRQKLIEAGVIVLEDTKVQLDNDGTMINLIGLADPNFTTYDYTMNNNTYQMEETLQNFSEDNKQNFTILLAHRPELIDSYTKNNVDLVFSGHAHGGQVRLPFLGGIVAPGQGFFPKYTAGLYQVSDTIMVVSRGLGNSIIPLRLFNRPEIIVVTLQGK